MPDEYIEYMLANPPRAIASSACPPHDALAERALENYGAYSTTFGLRCSCGSSTWRVTLDRDEYDEAVAVAASCSRCAKETVCFDIRHHGYNGEAGIVPATEASVKSVVRECASCSSQTSTLALTFQYSGNDEELNDPAEVARKQDFFSWFFAVCRCECGAIDEVASVECA